MLDADEPFLRALQRSRHESAFAPLDPQLVESLLEVQYLARRRGYATAFPRAEERLVLSDSTPIGVLITERHDHVIDLVDVALMPEARGAGVGSQVLKRLLAEAQTEERTVRLSVDLTNPRAHALYLRLGFVQTAVTGTQIVMERPPGPVSP